MNNYLIIEDRSKLYLQYVFLDIKDRIVSNLARLNGIKLRNIKCFCSESNEYELISCKIRRDKCDAFEECLKEAENKILLLGKIDYISYCDKLTNLIAWN